MRKLSPAISHQQSARQRILGRGIVIFLLVIACQVWLTFPVSAQLEIADTYDLADTEAQPGDILSLRSNGLVRSDNEYDSQVFGIINAEPLAVYRRVDGSGSPISRSGVVNVNVTTANGEIKTGDYITTSTLAGKGQKALASGYAIGVALADYNGDGGTEVDYKDFESAQTRKVKQGQVPVAIRIEYAELSTARSANAFLERLNSALFSSVKDPEKFVNVIRYVASGLVTIISILIGLFILARVIPKGVEGIGRNPLARQSIIMYTGINIAIVVIVIIMGIGISLLLLKV